MNKKEKISDVINGKKTHEIPYSFWTHLPKVDLNPVKLADETYQFYKEYDLDFIKTMNNGLYAVEDYGCECDFSEIEKGGVSKLANPFIHNYHDWGKVKPLSIQKGAFARELEYLKLLVNKLGNEAPVVFTIFSPITIANKLSNKLLLEHIKDEDNEKLVLQALDVITETNVNLVKKALEIGASGIFFASQLSSYDFLSKKQYLKYGLPFDVKVLQSASKGWFNILHIHGNNIMFDLLKDYPVQVINWHVWEAEPEIEKARQKTDKILMGGMVRGDITAKNGKAIYNQIRKTLKITGGYKIILTPGCVIRHPLNHTFLKSIKETKNDLENEIL